MLTSTLPNARRTWRLTIAVIGVGAVALGVAQSPADAQLQAHAVVVTDNPADWTPELTDGRVNAVLQMGSTVIIGGTFTQAKAAGGGATTNQSYILSFDATSGVIDKRFSPNLDAPVEALAPSSDGRSVIVGGSFDSVSGGQHHKLVEIDLSNGHVDNGFNADANGDVQELVAFGSDLYVSGKFTTMNGDPRSGMARLDINSGDVDPTFDVPFTQPPRSTMGVPEFSVNPQGTRLVAIGNFSKVDGLDRLQIAMLDLTTSPVSVAPWATDMYPVFVPGSTLSWCSSDFPTWMRDVDFSPDGSYFAVVTTGANRPNRLCDTVTRWETSATGTGLKPSWINWMGGDSIISVAATGAAIYIGGHQQYVNNPYVDQDCGVCTPAGGAIPREGLAALDPINGLPYTWDPGRSRGLGVMQFLSTAAGLWVGSDTDRLGNEVHPKLGFFPVAGGAVVPPNNPYTLPGTLYNMDAETGALLRRPYDLSTMGTTEPVLPGINWRKARGAFALNGQLYYGWANGTLRTRSFDGSQVGTAQTIDLNGLEAVPEPHTFFIPGTTEPVPSITPHLKNNTGMFFADGRIYYTVKDDPRLYYRYFTPESLTVGANLFVASTGDGVPWSKVRGMTMASGNLIYATGNGNLYQVDFDGHPVGTPALIGGPGVDGIDWASRGFFAFN
ncbi:MAG TPA: hypothetical protein VMT88_03725 [Actinomycetes bacterium]|nr:hypothetical protein [Actinomycetes bacterium]